MPVFTARLAEAFVGQNRPAPAVEEYEFAVRLAPEQNDLRFALAKACVDAKQTEKAREALESLLKRDPHFPGATELLEQHQANNRPLAPGSVAGGSEHSLR